MRSLLIVDDEKNIRLGLRAIIERGLPGSYQVQLAAEGEEALTLIREGGIELVITDIRMPGMDGLALIREVQSLSLETKPVMMILSGHDDFQYAKEAMLYDVKEYLLKPIVRDELFASLARVEQELARRAALTERLEEVHHYRDELLASQLNYIFLHPDMAEAEIAERCEKAGWGAVVAENYYVALLKLAGGAAGGSRAAQLEALVAGELGKGIRFYFKDKDERFVLLCESPEPLARLVAFMQKHKMAGQIGISGQVSGAGRVKEAYAEAREALGYGFLQTCGEPLLLHYDRTKGHLDEGGQVPVEEIRKLANMLGTDRDREMKAILTELLDAKKLAAFDMAYMEEISKQLNELVIDSVFNRYGEESVEILRIYKKVGSIYNFETIHDYFHGVEDLLMRLSDYVRSLRSVHAEHKEMKKAVSYIHENYHRDLNMAMVSNHVSLNYSYFSQSFKEFTGESFVTYLKKVRIEKAKALLLEEADCKIYEVSERVGFENAKQFNRVFREMEGISAMEYRTKAAVERV
ncbi:two-component system response regulator YesN [Paenibacillus taihuensis]|uniref:Two-component system response regulator YesN n=1 Tax=Paenibacillus taihuensis TaxID=1156355 RepID=A0A3D9RYZ5_9BACL|nr:response regulator [Paenibacillus taihuensis]REE85284.1 two-component system response regulator YesN [Paenibacillus taihuensis]